MSMKKSELQKVMKTVAERGQYYDHFKDQIVLPGTMETEIQETYFNVLNGLFTNSIYTDDNKEDIIRNRRICLSNIFTERVKFLMDEKLNFIKNFLESKGIICNITSHDIMKVDYRLFDLQTYSRYINNPISAGDCALLINSVIYNNIMQFRDLSVETNGLSYNELFDVCSTILNVALLDLVHMFNTIFLEANEIYFPAGDLEDENQQKQPLLLEGEERAKALKDIGREDLIDTDVKIGRV